MSPPRTAAVVGGGISGLAAALALRQVGVEAVVFERAPAFTEVGAGISLWPNATRVLGRLGVLDRLVETSGAITALTICDARGRRMLRAEIRSDAPALCAYRPDLIAALRGALPDDACRPGKALTALDADGDRARLSFADGTHAEADVVVGADGLRSAVRAYVVPGDPPPVYRGYPVWRGVGALPASVRPGEITESWGDRLRFGLVGLGGGRSYWYATAPRPEADAGPEPDLARLFAAWHAPIPEAIAATPPGAVLRGNTYDRRPRRGWSRGRAVLVGDAAHPTTPNLGQGGGMGIEDAVVLARCLAQAAPAEAFAAFERARFARTARVTRESLWTGRLGLAGGLAARLRDAGTRAMPDATYARRLDTLFDHAP